MRKRKTTTNEMLDKNGFELFMIENNGKKKRRPMFKNRRLWLLEEINKFLKNNKTNKTFH